MHFRSLGKCVAEYQRAAASLLEDPMNDYAGFTPDPDWYLRKLVQRHGFLNLEHFREEVVLRTSARWAHFNLF